MAEPTMTRGTSTRASARPLRVAGGRAAETNSANPLISDPYGGTTVVMEKFDAESALDAIQRYGVTHGQFVPAMFVRMLKLPEDVRKSYDMSSLQRVVHARLRARWISRNR